VVWPGTTGFAAHAASRLERDDPILANLIVRELRRQHGTLAMVAASSVADPSVLACAGSAFTNLTTEGYPGARFHAGCEVADDVERLAVERACAAFGATYANVQPHSGTAANLSVITALLAPGDRLLGMDLASGGHLTHGSSASVTGRYFDPIGYGVGADGRIDYDQVADLAREHRPKLIICGASAYPRAIDFKRFRAIADEVGAFLLADISHVAGLVAAGVHPSPIDAAHVTTTSTYKQLYGPRGGLILLGKDAETPVPGTASGPETSLRSLMQRAVFPSAQGTPDLAAVAAKARALATVDTPEFRRLAGLIVATASALAVALGERGYHVLTGGTDNHMVLVDLRNKGLSGAAAECALEECGIIVNRNRIPGDDTPVRVTAGLRFGTNTLALRGMAPETMAECVDIIDTVLASTASASTASASTASASTASASTASAPTVGGAASGRGDGEHSLDPQVRDTARQRILALCDRYPLPGYDVTRD
jgi:glycine hydroxymethyltransferase